MSTIIYMTEAGTGIQRPVSVDSIYGMDAYDASPEDLGLNKVPGDDDRWGDVCFSENPDIAMTALTLTNIDDPVFVLHTVDEIEAAMDAPDNLAHLHMNATLLATIANELQRIAPEVISEDETGRPTIHVARGFGSDVPIDFPGSDYSLCDVETIERPVAHVIEDFKIGLPMDGSCPADGLRALWRGDQMGLNFDTRP